MTCIVGMAGEISPGPQSCGNGSDSRLSSESEYDKIDDTKLRAQIREIMTQPYPGAMVRSQYRSFNNKAKGARVEIWRNEIHLSEITCGCARLSLKTLAGKQQSRVIPKCLDCGIVIDDRMPAPDWDSVPGMGATGAPKRLKRAVSGIFSKLMKVPDGAGGEKRTASVSPVNNKNAAKKNSKDKITTTAAASIVKHTKMYEPIRNPEVRGDYVNKAASSTESSLIDEVTDSSEERDQETNKRPAPTITKSAARLRRAQKLLEESARKDMEAGLIIT